VGRADLKEECTVEAPLIRKRRHLHADDLPLSFNGLETITQKDGRIKVVMND
jgi:hypothetical protein